MRGMNMEGDELDAFLAEQRTLYLATVSENGWPHVAPVGFARLEDNRLFVLTHPNQRKSKNVFQNNKVGVAVDEGDSYTALRGVFMHGYATVVADETLYPKLERAWVDSFYDGEIPDVVKKVYSKRDGWIWFEIEPVNTVTWDNRKLDPSRLEDRGAPSGSPFRYELPDEEEMGAAAPPE